MRTITVCFSKPKNKFLPIGSHAIRWYLGTEYSHVSFHFEVLKYETTLVYEAVGTGIRFLSKKNWEKHAESVIEYNIEVSDEVYSNIMKTCIDFSGNDYGYLQNLGVVIADIFNLDKNPFPSNQNCSELLCRILEADGYVFRKEYNLITPKDIEESIKNNLIL